MSAVHYDITSKGLPTYGNYGGPGWTGGKLNGTKFDVPAVNALDQVFKDHDLAYGNARSQKDKLLADIDLILGITGLVGPKERGKLALSIREAIQSKERPEHDRLADAAEELTYRLKEPQGRKGVRVEDARFALEAL
ncbi:hypothetical protein [Microvirga rosea]|uniref:hypothetical protein n=1 Tax=Microvirga rosea TaxID=2715425 RepID=UPI001D0B5F7A|nr:hypothetical protein [Microvirga rosea]MCB8821459.1 hypothetical protein [Microvirga rosea]